MIYLSSFRLSKRKVNNPNIYPYNVFRDKYIEPFVFRPITVLYGNNGSGKSTLLNIIANCLQLKGKNMQQAIHLEALITVVRFPENVCILWGRRLWKYNK